MREKIPFSIVFFPFVMHILRDEPKPLANWFRYGTDCQPARPTVRGGGAGFFFFFFYVLNLFKFIFVFPD
jgi:hypothetical protein